MAMKLAGDCMIRLAEARIELVAENVRFVLTLTNADARIWRYNISLTSGQARNQSAGTGRVVVDDCIRAAQHVAAIAGEGYEPGSVERGLFDAMAAGGISGWQQNAGEAARASSALRAVKSKVGDAAVTEISESGL